jgi:hypothetical protein
MLDFSGLATLASDSGGAERTRGFTGEDDDRWLLKVVEYPSGTDVGPFEVRVGLDRS